MIKVYGQEILAPIDVPAGDELELMEADSSAAVLASNQKDTEEDAPVMDVSSAPPIL